MSPQRREITTPDTSTLTAAIARGDVEAFGVFYESWFDRVHALARASTRRDESFCLDVAQDVMLRAVRSMRRFDDEAGLGRWLGRIVYSVAIDHLRREARRRRREEAVAAERPGAVLEEDRGELEERVAWLRARLAELDGETRGLLELRFVLGRSFEEVGAALGISANAAHGRVRRSVARLREAARRFFGESVL